MVLRAHGWFVVYSIVACIFKFCWVPHTCLYPTVWIRFKSVCRGCRVSYNEGMKSFESCELEIQQTNVWCWTSSILNNIIFSEVWFYCMPLFGRGLLLPKEGSFACKCMYLLFVFLLQCDGFFYLYWPNICRYMYVHVHLCYVYWLAKSSVLQGPVQKNYLQLNWFCAWRCEDLPFHWQSASDLVGQKVNFVRFSCFCFVWVCVFVICLFFFHLQVAYLPSFYISFLPSFLPNYLTTYCSSLLPSFLPSTAFDLSLLSYLLMYGCLLLYGFKLLDFILFGFGTCTSIQLVFVLNFGTVAFVTSFV